MTSNSLEEIIECPECTSIHLVKDYKHAELVCGSCGLVILEQLIDEGPEWRAFNSEQKDKRAHTGAPMNILIHDKGLSTEIGWQNRDSYGQRLPRKNLIQTYQMRKWQSRIKTRGSQDQNMARVLSELSKIASKKSFPKVVVDDAANIYRKSAKEKLIRGRSTEVVMLASLYASIRMHHYPCTLDELADAENTSKKIGRSYKFIFKTLKLPVDPPNPLDFIPRLCSELDLSRMVERRANKIICDAYEQKIVLGKSPPSIAAASVYIAAKELGEERRQKDIVDIVGITEVTIRNRYKELCRKLNIDVEENIRNYTCSTLDNKLIKHPYEAKA